MESENGRFYHQPSPPIRSGYMVQELVRPQLGHSEVCPQNLCYYPHSPPSLPSHSREFQELLLRELQKEQIREEMIVSEILSTRRALISELRREMMLEQELAPRLGSDGPLLGSTSTVGFNASSPLGPRAEEWPLGGRVVPSLMERERRLSSRNETGGYEVMMAPRGTSLLRISEVNPARDFGKEKKSIIVRANPDENVSGVKRKDLTTPPSVGGKSSLDYSSRKKAKNEWTCDICNVSTTSEQCLKDHLRGKKHKSKDAAMKMWTTGKNYCIGLYPNTATKPVEANPASEDLRQFTSDPPSVSKAEHTSDGNDAPLLQDSQNIEETKKNRKKVVKKMQKKNEPNKEKFSFYLV